jgi:hypothetical protein
MTTTPELFHLTDEQANAVFAAAHPLPPHRRSAFLEEVAREISRHPILGDGLLYRLIVQIQKKHYDVPDFGSDNGGKWNGKAVRRRRIDVDDSEDDRPLRSQHAEWPTRHGT